MSDVLAKIGADTAVLLAVDVQDRLLPAIHQADLCVEACRRMMQAAQLLGVRTMVTEQYPEGLGSTCAALRDVMLDEPVVSKVQFSACVEPVTAWLKQAGRPHAVVVGIETHVCVQQTVLDLLRLGYLPYVCADAVGSRRALDRDAGLVRMRQAGAVVTTTESVIFEMLGQAGTDAFKRILRIIK